MATAGIVLCADDYGIAPGVSRAIRDLLDRGRLSATGSMVVSPDFAAEGPLLAAYHGRADLGLHLTLTQDRPLGSLMSAAYTGRLDRRTMAVAVDQQIAEFTRIVGRPPDFIDGHQHVHLLPGVREAVTTAAQRIGAYVRLTDEPLAAISRVGIVSGKSALLSLIGRPLARRVRRSGIAHNSGFRGARSFAETAPYGDLFRRMIAGAGAGCLIMCHPGLVDEALASRDPVTTSREDEYRYLLSDTFPADLAAAKLHLSRLKDALAPG
jgi:chitin disaccharide deacetylase